MFDIPNGKYFRAFLASDDISTAAAITLKDMDGNTITLAAGQRVVLGDIVINNGGTARVVTIFQDTDGGDDLDSGEELYAASLAANSQNTGQFVTPILSNRINTAGTNTLFAVASGASAGTRIVITGTIINS